MEKQLILKMLGKCSITYGDKTINSDCSNSKKTWALLTYMITYRKEKVAKEKLIDVLYGYSDSANPQNALKVLIHRLRAMLAELDIPNVKDIIKLQKGYYVWNTDLSVSIDTEEFENLYTEYMSDTSSDDDRIKAGLNAIELYKGDFFADGKNLTWVNPLQEYHRTHYFRLVNEVVEKLYSSKRFEDVIWVCKNAIANDKYNEEYYCYLIKSLSELSRNDEAFDQYDKTMRLIYTDLGLRPSENLQSLYKELVSKIQNPQSGIGAITAQMRKRDAEMGALFCEYEEFREIYRLEVRSASRTGEPSHICLLTLDYVGSAKLSNRRMDSYLEKLKGCVKNHLRSADVFARISLNQLVILIPTTTQENAHMILERITKQFKTEHYRLPVELKYSFQAIEAML